MKLINEFKQFAVRGNAVDMAVGIIVGAGFTAIVNSFVRDVFTPPFGLITGNADFQDKILVLRSATEAREAVTLNYGLFISQVINFIIIAFAVFLLVKLINKWKDAHEVEVDTSPTTKNCQYCFSSISIKATKCPACTADNP